MIQAIKETVIIRSGGLIEIRRSDLPEGAAAEVIIIVDGSGSPPPPLASLLGKAHSGYVCGAEADAFLRTEWNGGDR